MEEEKDDLFIDDSQRNLANVKKMVWQGFKTFVPGGSLGNVFLDQNEMGDLELTKPKYAEAIPFIGEFLQNKIVDEVFNMPGEEFRKNYDQFNKRKNNKIIKAGEGEYDPGNDEVYIPKEELTRFQRDNQLWSVAEPNYDAIEGADELTPNFLNQWQKRAKTGEKTYYFDITNHRILDVPGMENIVNQTRYKQWLTQNLINRYNQASLYPDVNMRTFLNTDFYDSKDQVWRLVKVDPNATGPGQGYIPMLLSEIDSRKMKSENSSDSDRVLLTELKRLNVSERNAIEREHPWLIEWNSDTSGQNYHEHMFGLDETEFWKSAYGKSLGYMNNDVYVLSRGLGNIVFLNDPKFKVMKDQIADYITPHDKVEIYPGLRRRLDAVKTFKAGKYKGLNAIIGYEANPNSPYKSDLVLYAYDPSETENIGFKTEFTIPNYYSVLYTKKADGSNLFPKEIRDGMLHSLIDSYLNDTPQKLVALEDLTQHIFKQYGVNIDLQNPKALEQWDEEFNRVGQYSVGDPWADQKVFKTTPKNERLQKKEKKKRIKEFLRLLDIAKNGPYQQLLLELDL